MRHWIACGTALFVLLVLSSAECFRPPRVMTARDGMFAAALGSQALVKGGTVEPHWLADGKRFWYKSGVGDPVVFLVDAAAGTKKPFFDDKRLRDALEAKTGKKAPTGGSPIHDFEYAEGEGRVRFRRLGKFWQLTLADYRLDELGEPKASAPDRPRLIRSGYMDGEPPVMEAASPDGSRFATEKDFNIGIRRAGADAVTSLTTGGSKDHRWAADSALWSPDGTRLVALRVDSRKVPKYPVVRWLSPDLPVDRHPRARPGGPIPLYEMAILGVASKGVVTVRSGRPPDWSIAPVRWTEDGAEVLFLRRDRESKREELVAARADTGETRIILTETSETFVQIPLLDKPQVPGVARGKQFLWLSERTGWNHIYLYSLDGKLIRALTRGDFHVVKILEIDHVNGWVYFSAHDDPERPYDTHICRVHLSGERFRRLTEAEGQHDFPSYLASLSKASPVNARFSPKKEFFLDTHSSILRRPRVDLRKADGTFVMTVEEADDRALRASKLPPPEPFVAKAADGKTTLHGSIYKPSDFDRAKKYPVLDYIYNGPQTTWVPRTYNAAGGLLPLAFAQLGYVVVVLDGRGTPERGKKFQDVVYGKFGQHEVPDHRTALEQAAATRPWMDLDRVGVFGGSFGGYMTVRAMLAAPAFYKVGVATAPVYDPSDLPAFIEVYMGSPGRNPRGYAAASCRPLAGKLEGKLLILHGTSDVNAPFSGTIRMAEAFAAAGKSVDLQIFPEGTHFPAPRHQLFYLNRIRRYFEEHLAP